MAAVLSPVMGSLLMYNHNFKDLTGQRFGRLKVINRAPNKVGSKKVRWKCSCDCGKSIDTLGDSLKRGDTTSCGCFRIELNYNRLKLKPFEGVYRHLVRTYKSRNLEDSTLSYIEFLEFIKINNCHYCGALIQWDENFHRYHLDRKDSEKGYTKENCVVCCTRCNWCKSDRFTYEQWKSIGNHIQNNIELFFQGE